MNLLMGTLMEILGHLGIRLKYLMSMGIFLNFQD